MVDAFRVEVRPVGEVEDRGVHGFFLLLVVAVITKKHASGITQILFGE